MPTVKGFTFIELVVVILILGILGAIAIPQFIDLDTESNQATVDGIAGALNSAAALNYAACQANSIECDKTVANCTDFGKNPIFIGGLEPNYAISPLFLATGEGSTTPCVVTHLATRLSANFTGIKP